VTRGTTDVATAAVDHPNQNFKYVPLEQVVPLPAG